jgi:hypothetical protein
MSDAAKNASAEHRKLAGRLLAARAPVAEVEQALVEAGMEPVAAGRLVDRMLAKRLAPMPEPAPPAPSWWKIGMGLALAAVGFVVAYAMLKEQVPGERFGRFPLLLPGGGIAIAGLNLVRSELMKYLD